VLVPLHSYKNGAYIGDLDRDGRQELVTWGDNSFVYTSRGECVINEQSAVRILRVQEEGLKLLFRQVNLRRFLKVLIRDLDKDGRKEVICNWESGGSAGYGETTIIFCEGGLFKSYYTEKLSRYSVKATNLDGDGRIVILAYHSYPPGYYHMGEEFFPVPYQWAKGTLVLAPLDIRKAYYSRFYIPEVQESIKTFKSRDSREDMDKERIHKEVILFAQRMTKEPFEQVLRDIRKTSNGS
jgi:hypothetical protein